MSRAAVLASRTLPLPARAPAAGGVRTLAAATVFVAVAALLLYRSSRGGLELRDFRDAVYFPVVALLDGHNPYDTAAYLRTYPVQQEFPPYLPLLLTVHLPFGLLRFEVAQVAYFLLTAVLTVGLAALTLGAARQSVAAPRVFALATLMILSRPGYWNLALGQVTVPVTIGMYIALRYVDDRRWLAALGLALALLKPTYGVPLAVLVAARGGYRVAVIGALLAMLLSVGPCLALVHDAGGVTPLIASVGQSYASFGSNPDAGASSSPDRIDAVAMLAHALGHDPSTPVAIAIAVGILATAGLAIRRLARRRDGRALADSVVCLAVLTCIYHQAYDLLALALPLTLLAAGRLAPPRWRWALIACLGIPAADYLAARPALQVLGAHGVWGTVLISINGVALLVGFAVCLWLAWHQSAILPQHSPGRVRWLRRAA